MVRQDANRLPPVTGQTSETNPLRQAVAGGEVALVIRTIKQRYGFTVTSEYARDFIRFVNEVTSNVSRK